MAAQAMTTMSQQLSQDTISVRHTPNSECEEMGLRESINYSNETTIESEQAVLTKSKPLLQNIFSVWSGDLRSFQEVCEFKPISTIILSCFLLGYSSVITVRWSFPEAMCHEIPQQIEHKIRYENLQSIKLNILPLFLLIFFCFGNVFS